MRLYLRLTLYLLLHLRLRLYLCLRLRLCLCLPLHLPPDLPLHLDMDVDVDVDVGVTWTWVERGFGRRRESKRVNCDARSTLNRVDDRNVTPWRGLIREQAIAITSLGKEDGLCSNTSDVEQSPDRAHADIGRPREKKKKKGESLLLAELDCLATYMLCPMYVNLSMLGVVSTPPQYEREVGRRRRRPACHGIDRYRRSTPHQSGLANVHPG